MRLFSFCSQLDLGRVSALLLFGCCGSMADNWPRFRGPTGDGVVSSAAHLPTEFGLEVNLAWKSDLPEGHSSPIAWGDQIFVAGAIPGTRELVVLSLATASGQVQWRATVTVEQFENVHKVSNAATATPVTDGERVISFFGSFGMVCHDLQGRELWRYPMPRFESINGSGTSPALAEGTVLLNREDKVDQVLIALDARNGHERWKFKHPNAEPNPMGVASTPLVWQNQILLHRAGALSSHSLKDGSVNWFVPAKTTGCATPIVDGSRIIFCAWNNAGEPAQIPPWPKFPELLAKYDLNHDSKLSREEFPSSLSVAIRPGVDKDLGSEVPFQMIWDMFDRNRDNAIDAEEFADGIKSGEEFLRNNKHGVTAVTLSEGSDPGVKGVAWKIEQGVPEVPSPLAWDGKIYLVRNGGLFTCVDAASGKRLYDERLGVPGVYYASPIVADGKIYVGAGAGQVMVLAPGDEFRVLARNDLKEPIFASPAVVGNKLLVRTTGHLYAFESPKVPR
jgi:outer membrane protein assembly factor BamB